MVVVTGGGGGGDGVEVEINSPCNLWDHEMGYISNKT